MAGDNADLVLTGLVLTIMVLIFAIVWFVFLMPMEKGLYKRRMEQLQKKLQQNEERLRREAILEKENATVHDEQIDDRHHRRSKQSGA